MEGTAPVAVAAAHAVPGPLFRGQVVLPGQAGSQPGQVVILVDQGHVQPGGTGGAVLAVYAFSHGVRRGEAADGGIVPLLRRGIQEAQHLP